MDVTSIVIGVLLGVLFAPAVTFLLLLWHVSASNNEPIPWAAYWRWFTGRQKGEGS
jgi:hypothetical protein